ncbi:MAG TPA: TIGR03118 family protein [Verrucomicrobiae bacterium]|jgi:uncharacterized protein (TIGR03118 family)|nr:TIGR03118 family protein [Verrucomicrobiae bacterium]
MNTKLISSSLFILGISASTLPAQNAFVQHNLVSDIPGLADHTDTNLVNPWGISFSSGSPFWISDNGAGVSTLYNGSGVANAMVVAIPPPAGGTPPSAPTGTIFNGTTDFKIAGVAAKFIFDTEDGTIAGWTSGANAVLELDSSAGGAVFKGLATGAANGSNYLYATDFHNNKIVVLDGNWSPFTPAGSFADPSLPAGYAPFGIQNLGGKLFVTYALQDSDAHDDIGGPGHGYVDVFDTSGNLLHRLISAGALNSPWGVATAPNGFGTFGGDLLVGNFGDGMINVFNATNGAWVSALNDTTGHPISEPGLWGIAFGNGGNGGKTNILYFAAGIAADGAVEDHGLLASVTPAFQGVVGAASYIQRNLVSDLPGMAENLDTNLVNPWGISFSGGSPFWLSDNGTGVSTLYNGAGISNPLIVTVPTAAGGTPPSAPTGTVFNGTPDFQVAGASAKFIFDTEDGTISGWASGGAAILEVDNSASGAVFKGLAIGSAQGSNYLYATDFHNNQVLMIDGHWQTVKTFTDGSLPPGFAPFGIQNIGGKLYVTFALQDADAHDDIGGPGNGYVDVFDTSGNLLRQLIAGGALNSPWGTALAPAGFGAYGGALLIGNFGDGYINAYQPATGDWIGPVFTSDGSPFSQPGMWGLAFGNGGSGSSVNILYFTAGIAGPDAVEDHGLFGSLNPATVSFTTAASANGAVVLNWTGGVGPFNVQETTNLASPINWSTLVSGTTNLTVTVTNNNPNAYFRILDVGRATP